MGEKEGLKLVAGGCTCVCVFMCVCVCVLAAGLPRQDHVYITADESFRFHNNKFNKLLCKLDSTENPCSFEKHPTPPQ